MYLNFSISTILLLFFIKYKISNKNKQFYCKAIQTDLNMYEIKKLEEYKNDLENIYNDNRQYIWKNEF